MPWQELELKFCLCDSQSRVRGLQKQVVVSFNDKPAIVMCLAR